MTGDSGLAGGQIWKTTVGPLQIRRIERMGTGHASGREDLWYRVIGHDGSEGALRSCFTSTWKAWERRTGAELWPTQA